jgi:hypothetical protein
MIKAGIIDSQYLKEMQFSQIKEGLNPTVFEYILKTVFGFKDSENGKWCKLEIAEFKWSNIHS